jgi:phenylpyruvate tautomerase PptA (4-oxalocrotonate tautomerase family)
MPYWKIYHPQGAYSREDKRAFSEAITEIYTEFARLPRFYVVVLFEERPPDSIWVGGEPANKFVRIAVDHIARTVDTPELKLMTMESIEAAIEPFVSERGFDWEVHVDETPFELWRTQGFVPPPPESPEEARWAEDNRASPWHE